MNDRIAALLEEVKEGLEGIYGEGLKGVTLYGSYARGKRTVNPISIWLWFWISCTATRLMWTEQAI